MRYLIFTIVFLFNLTTGSSQQVIDNAAINFKIKNIGTYAKGTFSESLITCNFKLDDLETSFLKVTIQVKSVDTGIKKRDKHLLEDDYFHVAAYPAIQFSSTKIEKKSNADYIVHGELTIKNTNKQVQLPLAVEDNGNSLSLRSDFVLSRKEYGVGGRSWILSDKVKAQVQFSVKKP